MSLDGAYDEGNPFALILAGKLPAARIWEDEHVLAFMDVFPQAEGHALVISKTSRARNMLEMEPDALCRVMAAARRVAIAIRAALAPEGIQIMQTNGAAAGQTVFHLHVHVIPRAPGSGIGFVAGGYKGGMADQAELQALAARIAAHLPGA